MPRVIAIDWSGDARAARRTIWLAEIRGGAVTRLEAGRDRSEVTAFLLEEAQRDSDLVVGLDFAFSLPAWYLLERGVETATAAWDLVAREGELWLSNPRPPFGRTSKPWHPRWFRQTELDLHERGARPKTVFQVGGIGQVGKSSVRGMPFLRRLRGRFAVWPFDEPRLPLAVEIYPRVFIAGFSERVDRAPNEHARDALVSAHAMADWPGDWTRLPLDSRYELEGRIWEPGTVQQAM